jgi:poly(A) polymerase
MSDASLPTLSGQDWLEAPSLQAVFDALEGRGVTTRVVGGAVRNTLLGGRASDVDLATVWPPEEVCARTVRHGLKAIPTGMAHGTVTIVSDHTAYEVTTLRADVETFGRRATVAFHDDWEADARRRDVTMNALYANRDGTLFDPVGGYADVLARRVRFIGDPVARIREDYLRILRFFRFHAWYGGVEADPRGLAACVAERQGLAQLSRERVGAEMMRLLAAPQPLPAMAAMADCGILRDVIGAPGELAPLSRLVAIEAAQGLAPDPVLRLAVLAVRSAADAERLRDRLRLSNREVERLVALTEAEEVAPYLDVQHRKALLYRRGEAGYRDHLLAAWARSDHPPDDEALARALLLPAHWQAPRLPVSGADLLAAGLPPGPRVGAALARAQAAFIASDFALTRDDLIALATEEATR